MALKTDHELLSIEDHNRIMREEVRAARAIGAGIQLVLLLLLLYLFYQNRPLLGTLRKRKFRG